MSTSPPGSPGPQFDPPASWVPGQPPQQDPSAGPQFSAPGAGAQSSAPGVGPQYQASAPQPERASEYPPATAYPAPGFPGPQAGSAPGYQPAAAYPAGPLAPGALPTDPQEFPVTQIGDPGAPPATYPERVGLGLASAGAVVLGCVALTAAIYHWGFIASITAWLMAVGASWAYRKVGGEPVKGRVPLLVLILVGIVLGFLAMVASAVWDYYWVEMGSAGDQGEAIQLVLDNLFNVELWQDLGMDALFYFLFAALGAFGVIRRMSGRKQATA